MLKPVGGKTGRSMCRLFSLDKLVASISPCGLAVTMALQLKANQHRALRGEQCAKWMQQQQQSYRAEEERAAGVPGSNHTGLPKQD
ncbi:hypothetical protein EYF80_002669 [Liparis tanakae]|uniref:Uncharacterized protein n=1 Tax=Liparis tanakae TaxID=230148 RepID=A0A4Z2JAS2_9TELE|nr:hypothetical protein EYF80_002669 [Liparis tanakae]